MQREQLPQTATYSVGATEKNTQFQNTLQVGYAMGTKICQSNSLDVHVHGRA